MIFWQHVKGFNKNGTNDLWSYIIFQTRQSSDASCTNVPILKTYDRNRGETELYNFGYLITQNAKNQHITNSFDFDENLSIAGQLDVTLSSTFHGLTILENDNYLNYQKYLYLRAAGNSTNGASIRYSNDYLEITSTKDMQLDGGKDYSIKMRINSTQICSVTSGGLGVTGDAIISNKCEANFFNAKSDIRAKTNIKPLEIKALDLIKKVPLYSFIYKETNTPSIGIIAQDVQSVQIDGFKLVDNENATGKDMDYMTIHESKLTYILWKAIKEQQEIIENLQNQINELKKN